MSSERALPIALVGLRCSGKTTAGGLLAQELGLEFADLDERLLARWRAGAGAPAGSAGELLARLGEPEFRRLEREALAELLADPRPAVIATGGGAVEDPDSRALLAERARCAWLRVPLEELARRLAADPAPRPRLAGRDALGEVRELAARRAPLYREVARWTLDCGLDGPPEVVARLRARIGC